MKIPRLRLWLAAGVAGAVAAVGALTAPTAQAATGCRVDYTVTNQWQGGFGANVDITNLGDPINGWRLTWSFTAGQTISQLWNGSVVQSSSQVTVTNAGYNGSLGTGASTNFGFNGAWNGSNPMPTTFALNGVTCTGDATGTPTPTPTAPTPTPTPSTSLPCDIYAAGGTPCIAAHSTVRALFRSYGGNLYQVRRSSDNTTRNIGVLTTGGSANAAAQDSFCAGTTCVITHHLRPVRARQQPHVPGTGWNRVPPTAPRSATTESLTVGGNKVYSLYINPGNSYWRDGHLTGVPTGSAPEGMYMVTSGTHVNSGCCFDYGNSETTSRADGAGAMDAIYFGTSCWFGGCSGSGPWVQADLEYGLYPGGSQPGTRTRGRSPADTSRRCSRTTEPRDSRSRGPTRNPAA